MANSGSWIQLSREGITDTWQTGIDSDNSYVIRASNSADVVTVNPNGDTASGNLDVGQDQAQTSINAYVNHIGKTSYVEMEARWANQCYINFKTDHTYSLLLFAAKVSLKEQVYTYSGNDIVHIYEDTTRSGNLDVGKILNLQRHPTESDTIPLIITNTSSSGSGFIGKFVSAVKGCLFEYLTSASSTSWWQGV